MNRWSVSSARGHDRPGSGHTERACLGFCEQFFIDVANVTTKETEAIDAELGVQGLADFVNALLVIEQRLRLRLAWDHCRRGGRLVSHDRRIPAGVHVTASLHQALEEWQASVVLLDRMDPVTTELVRLRAAAYHDCRTCKSLRTTTGHNPGVDETMTAKVERYETSDLPERHKVALRFTDTMMTQPGEISSELERQLHRHFSDAELLELSLDVMKWNYQKVPVALRTDAEPVPGHLTLLEFDEQGRHRYSVPAPTNLS